MKEEEYLNNRLEDQINWYSQKSLYNQKWYKMLRLIEIVSAALIPFLSGMHSNLMYSNWLIGGLGVLIAVAAAAGALFKFHEQWIQYRTTSEQLKHEKYIYLTMTHPYDNDNRYHLLVERVENLISKENIFWSQASRKQAQSTRKE